MSALAREAWDDAVRQRGGSFLQSWMWGEFQNAVGNRVTRISDPNGAWVAQWVLQAVRFGHQLACYHGPVPASAASIEGATVAVQGTAAAFLHLELPYDSEDCSLPGWRNVQFRQAPATQVLDLTESLEEFRSALHPKTRYNIGLAERSGVSVHLHTEVEAIETFLPILPKTSERHGIAAHSPNYYRAMARTLAPERMLAVFTAERDGRTVAANIMLHFGNTVTYLHGASEYSERKLMAPHLLQWHQIRWAREQGARIYDFGGVAPPDSDPSHPFAGITRFKQGFGGRTVVSPGAYDLPLKRAWYTLYRAAKMFRG